ncbi:hypothetical protein BJV77DRAFT_595226 [Russula vinacea]|nr:hypothetical protein BJV77DRAFT_595226 [Russula vinacea]
MLVNVSSHTMGGFPDKEPGAVQNSRRRNPWRPSSNLSLQDDEKDTKSLEYCDTSATYWNLYGSKAKISDKELVESLLGHTNSLVFLITLFSSIVALFIIEIYKTLLPSNNPSSRAVRINIVLFLSFFLSIISAVTCALVQQWCYEYLKHANPWAAPHDCGRVRTYLYKGLAVRGFIYGIHALLHISVILFFWAITDFFHTIHEEFGNVTSYTLYVSAIIYILLSTSPLIFSSSPYHTPMTPILRIGWITVLIVIRFPLWWLSQDRNQQFDLTGFPYYKGIRFDRTRLYSIKAEERAEKLEPYAMKWLFTENVFSEKDMDMFLEGLPGYISSSHTKKGQLYNYLTADYILSRIKEHLITCVTSVKLSDEASIARVSSSIKALLLIFQYSPARKQYSPVPDKRDVESQLQRTYIQRLMEDFRTLCGMDDQMIALRASCIRALAAQCLLSELVPRDKRTFPISLIPIYTFFFPSHNLDTIWMLDYSKNRSEEPSAAEIETMWKNLLHHGPLANLTKLAEAVRDRERAPPSTLSFCWKVLDNLLTHLESIDSEEPNFANRDFDILHKNIRTYVHKERGSPVTPLLDILDTVARGRRLLMVFSSHTKYHNRPDVAFGKEYLRNGNLLEAFAHCLPDFISKNPNTCKEFMEKVVRHDNLWSCLQENLSNTEKSDADSPTPASDKLRVFEHCCTVLDLAFSVLEDSQEVDWRAPEFGSLSEHFQSFIEHNLQCSLTIINFRVGVINARFCKALLAQFWNDLDRKGTVSFRSQWDVISLERLVCTLGLVRCEEEEEFRHSYVIRGHIGAEFRTKALEMIHKTECDGPLLIFCRLGHLVLMAVVLDHSGVESEDIEVVMKLQRKVIEKVRKPLNEASETSWETLDGLQKQVKEDLCATHSSKNKEMKILQDLLQMIESINESRSSGSEGPNQTEPAEEQGPETLVAMRSTSSLGELRRIGNGFGSPSEPTAEPSSGTQAGEGEGGFEHRGMMSYGRTESPQRLSTLSSYSLAFPHPPSPLVTVQGSGVRMMPRRSFSAPTPSISSYFPYVGDGQRPFRRQTLENTDASSTSRRNAPTARPNPAVSPQMYLLTPVTEDELSRPPSRP